MATERRLIDANALLVEVVKAQALEPLMAVAKIIMLLTEAERVDAVEVVRCEKCRYYEKAEYDEGYKMVCRLLKRQTAGDGYCYCGARRSDG
jgi:hypothetical protein